MNPAIQIIPSADKPQNAEVRCSVRFPLTLPIRIITDKGEYDATTENISASGVLFRSNQDPGIDDRVEFLLKMPADVIGADADVTLRCYGRVIRSYQGQRQFHAAAIIDDYLFSPTI